MRRPWPIALLSLGLLGAVLVVVMPAKARGQEAASASPASTAAAAAQDYGMTADEYQRAVEYSRQKYLQYFLGTLYGFLALLIVLTWKIAPAYRRWAERASRPAVQALIFAPLLLLTVAALGLPSDVWQQAIERRFGRSVQSWGSWIGDWLTAQVITLIVGTVLVWILYAVIRRSPRRWWFYFWVASLPVLLFVLFVSPLVIDPLFFKYIPLAPHHPDLVAEIQKVSQRGGLDIPNDRMFEMIASTKLTGLNAYVAGFGSSKRVVVWDTTLAKATIPETLFVFGHEMGHYVLLHIPKEIGILALLFLGLFYLGYRMSARAVARWGGALGIRDMDDWASLPVLMLVLSVLSFLATPAFNGVSRHFEHEADRYGLEVIHGIVPEANQVATGYFRKSGVVNLADPNPDPFIEFWLFDHPSRPERIRFVSTYDPWAHGEQPRYVK